MLPRRPSRVLSRSYFRLTIAFSGIIFTIVASAGDNVVLLMRLVYAYSISSLSLCSTVLLRLCRRLLRRRDASVSISRMVNVPGLMSGGLLNAGRSTAWGSDPGNQVLRSVPFVVRSPLNYSSWSAPSCPLKLVTYEAVSGIALADYLDDPIAFSDALHQALSEIFVSPFNASYPTNAATPFSSDNALATTNNHQQPLSAEEELATALQLFATEVSALMEQSGSPLPAVTTTTGRLLSPDQLLEDLESLQWIIAGQPSHATKLLQTLYLRYADISAPAGAELPTLWYRMRTLLFTCLSPDSPPARI